MERVKLKLFSSAYPFPFRVILTVATIRRIPFIVRAAEMTFLNDTDPFCGLQRMEGGCGTRKGEGRAALNCL